MRPLLAVCCLLLGGCLTPAELRETADALRGEWHEKATEVDDQVHDFAGALDELADTLEARQATTEEAIEGLKEGGIVGALATALAAMYGTNRIRDRKRKVRGEAT